MSLLYFNFFRESNIDVYLLEKENGFTTTVRNFKDIGPDFNFNLKVSSCGGETDESFRLFTTRLLVCFENEVHGSAYVSVFISPGFYRNCPSQPGLPHCLSA